MFDNNNDELNVDFTSFDTKKYIKKLGVFGFQKKLKACKKYVKDHNPQNKFEVERLMIEFFES